MTFRTIAKDTLHGTGRHVRNDAYETFRFLLGADGLDVTVTDITLAPGIEAEYGHDRHVEIAYCIEGEATVTDRLTGREHAIAPGVMWTAERGDRFLFRARVPTRLICVFTPPFEGGETGFAGDQ